MIALLMAGSLATAAPAVQEEQAASDEIVVTAPGEPFAVPVAKLLKAVAAFDKDHARLAPQGILWFELSPRDPAKWEGLTAALTDGTATIPVVLDSNGRFRLPPLPPGDWTLRANRRGSSLAFRALVRTPGFDGDQRRLGDMRLHCRVNWAVQSDRYSFVQRAGFGMIGGCDTTHIAFFFRERRTIAAASLRGRSLPIGEGGHSFFAPVGMKKVGNDEIITLAFR
ncbi:carboxypeptidase-like regulatory domain-containing protein [Sphingomonas bacterium]|uniref:carboxypeptidase-like regulatory domain-containing protein n=1 Tax=Sphingomonas bacterium TaxID=1895847 RepID=UPI001577663E|nr:carboxypeptidase-like regulatory domain-containing protein [Sphingomonas bacterium]